MVNNKVDAVYTSGQLLIEAREMMNISPATICEIMQISVAELMEIEDDRRKPSVIEAVKLAAILSADFEYILFPNGVKEDKIWIETMAEIKKFGLKRARKT